jgi:hypothetical protein
MPGDFMHYCANALKSWILYYTNAWLKRKAA